MLTVQGYIDGVLYTALVGGEIGTELTGHKITGGPVRVATLLAEHDGERIAVTPVGPFITADAGTEEGVLAILRAHSQVIEVDTDDGSPVPDPLGPTLPGVAY